MTLTLGENRVIHDQLYIYCNVSILISAQCLDHKLRTMAANPGKSTVCSLSATQARQVEIPI